MLLKHIYTVFLAVLIVTFVGVGISAFYKAPKYPEYPPELNFRTAPIDQSTNSAELMEKQIKFEKESRNFQKVNENYSRNVSTIALVASLIILVLSITLVTKIDFMSDGILLGGVFTLVYSIIRGFDAGDEKFRFIVVTVGLAVAMFLGYWRFVKTIQSKKR